MHTRVEAARGPTQPSRSVARWVDMRRSYFAVALGYLLLLPPQLNLIIGTSVIAPSRILLIPSVLYILWSFLRGQVRFTLPDMLIVITTFWVGVSLFITTEADEALTAVVAQTTDIALSYFFARATLRTADDLRRFLILMAPGFIGLGLLLFVESATGKHLIQNLFSSLTGRSVLIRTETRLGFMRAAGPFPHPILAGLFLSTLLPLYAMAGIRGWPKWLGIASSFFGFFSLSSAAILGLVANGALLIYDWICQRIENLTWRLFLFAMGTAYAAVELASNSGFFNLLVRYGSLNTGTAFNRVLIWKYGSASVMAKPWFGRGYADWDRPAWMVSSVDNYWLVLSIQFGILPAVLVALVTILVVFALMRAAAVGPVVNRPLYRGLAISIAVFALGVISVSIWLSAQTWYYMLLGVAASVTSVIRQSARRPGPVPMMDHRRLPMPVAQPR